MSVTQFTGAQLITELVRRAVSDAVAEYRWDNTTMLRYLNSGRRELVGRQPQAAYVDSVVTGPISDLASLGVSLEINPAYYSALAHHVIWQCLSEDSEHNANHALAGTHYDLFLKESSE